MGTSSLPVHRIRLNIADDWKLYHDNVPAHTAFLVTHFLADSKVTTIPQPPNSSDVAPPEFFLFPRPKTPIKGHHFETVNEVKEACTKALKYLPEKAYRDAFDAWKSLRKRCIDAGGAYYETF